MYFSEKRKQGLGSLRPGYFLGGTIGNFLLGNALNWGINKGIDYATKTPQQREDEKLAKTFRRLGVQPYISGDYGRGNNEEEEDKGKKSSTFKGAFGRGLMSLLATALFGPLVGPFALRAGKGLINKKKQMSLMPSGDPNQITSDPRGTFTAEGRQFENIQDSLGSTDPNKHINYNTGVITDKTTGKEIGNVYDEVALTNVPAPPAPPAYDFDDGGSDSGSSGSTGSMSASDFSDDSPGTPFFKGGRVSYSKGGIASLWQR